jgi:protein arginine kinase activator
VLCDQCQQRPAVLQLTETAPGAPAPVQRQLCLACAAARGIGPAATPPCTQPTPPAPPPTDTNPGVSCPRCGWTADRVRTSHRLGCAACYGTFAVDLAHALPNLQPGTVYAGKRPGVVVAPPVPSTADLDELNRSLRQAVAAQDYERAARLRDAIRRTTAELTPDPPAADASPRDRPHPPRNSHPADGRRP